TSLINVAMVSMKGAVIGDLTLTKFHSCWPRQCRQYTSVMELTNLALFRSIKLAPFATKLNLTRVNYTN
ncbi:hypothetical protein J6590_049509, partial [Homalodisca vitripennis]